MATSVEYNLFDAILDPTVCMLHTPRQVLHAQHSNIIIIVFSVKIPFAALDGGKGVLAEASSKQPSQS